jgi:hypothetical protein
MMEMTMNMQCGVTSSRKVFITFLGITWGN